MGGFTDRLKYAIIKALYEYVNKSDVSNLRPLSLFKFLENVMQSRISRHLTKHSAGSTEQNTCWLSLAQSNTCQYCWLGLRRVFLCYLKVLIVGTIYRLRSTKGTQLLYLRFQAEV
jgi:hypothetical protein